MERLEALGKVTGILVSHRLEIGQISTQRLGKESYRADLADPRPDPVRHRERDRRDRRPGGRRHHLDEPGGLSAVRAARDLGIVIGEGTPGPLNAITDVAGVRVGHTTLISGEGPLVVGVGPGPDRA